MESFQPRYFVEVDQEKAALNGIPVAGIVQALSMQLSGKKIGLLHRPLEKEDLNIVLRQSVADKSDLSRLLALSLPGPDGPWCPYPSWWMFVK